MLFLCDAVKIADDKDEREDAISGDAADKNHGTYERACSLDDNADGNGVMMPAKLQG